MARTAGLTLRAVVRLTCRPFTSESPQHVSVWEKTTSAT
jgi:hypothetical protein